MHPIDGLVRQAERDAHGSVTMHSGVDVGPGFENLRIDDRFARNGADAGKLLQGKIEMNQPIFLVALWTAKHSYGDSLAVGQARAHVAP